MAHRRVRYVSLNALGVVVGVGTIECDADSAPQVIAALRDCAPTLGSIRRLAADDPHPWMGDLAPSLGSADLGA